MSLYLLYLPSDILSSIPTFIMNAGMGECLTYLDPPMIINDIAGMPSISWYGWQRGVLLLLIHLVKEGLKAIGWLASNLWYGGVVAMVYSNIYISLQT
jgi:hypothetical protein